MNPEDSEGLLSRWSRLKKEAARAEEKPAEPKPPAAAGPAQAAAAAGHGAAAPSSEQVPLPSLDSLKGLASDYTGFLKPGIDEDLKRAALKKLFRDPHFETFERFEAYCEDYTQGEPIPAAMLKTLAHAKGLLFGEEKEEISKEDQAIASEPAEPLPDPAGKIETGIQAEVPAGDKPEKA